MDGYAVRIEDLRLGGTLEHAGACYAGHLQEGALEPGTALAISTGAAVPRGANTILRKEYAQLVGKKIKVLRMPKRGQDIRPQGEEWQAGECLLHRGKMLTPAMIAVAAALGKAQLEVQALPRLRICSSGDEIAGEGQDQVPDSNGPFLQAVARVHGVVAREGDVLSDQPDLLLEQLRQALQGVDLLVTSGAMSVGDKDGMLHCAQVLGAELLFHGVDIRPGRPIGAARLGQTLWLMLPGSPGAVMMGAELFLKPLLEKMGAVQPVAPQRAEVRLAPSHAENASGAELPKPTGPVRMRWGTIEAGPEDWTLLPSPELSPHHLRTPLQADGYALCPGSEKTGVNYTGKAPAPFSAWPVCVGITGPSGSGKTTLIRRLLDHLSPEHRVVVIKHSHHPVPPEPGHKDTARFLQAGAESVLFVSGSEFVLRSQGPDWSRPVLQRWVARMEPCPELVIIEGFSSYPGPRVEVLGPEDTRGVQELEQEPRYQQLLACVVRGRAAPVLSVPVFDSEAISEIAQWLLRCPVKAS